MLPKPVFPFGGWGKFAGLWALGPFDDGWLPHGFLVSRQGLRGFANEKKVWIGGMPAGPTSIEMNKKLKEHMSQAGG